MEFLVADVSCGQIGTDMLGNSAVKIEHIFRSAKSLRWNSEICKECKRIYKFYKQMKCELEVGNSGFPAVMRARKLQQFQLKQLVEAEMLGQNLEGDLHFISRFKNLTDEIYILSLVLDTSRKLF